jgi:hypothetical protein
MARRARDLWEEDDVFAEFAEGGVCMTRLYRKRR